MPAASIIVPVYNKARYLKNTLDSILAQSHADFELLIIDDGSTDGSTEITAAITDHRVRIFRQENSGVSSARNLGISLARSDLILFFDADDWMHEDYLKTHLTTADKMPGHSFFATAFKRFPARAASPELYQPHTGAVAVVIHDLPATWLEGQTFITSCVAVRRSALAAEPSWFPVGESFGEDMDLWLRLAEKHGLVWLPAPLVGYREDAAGNLTSMKPITSLPAYILRLEARAKAMPAGVALRRSTLGYVADARVSLARQLLAHGLRLKSVQTLMGSIDPGWRRPRWWVTLVMCGLAPRSSVSAWEKYRIGRTQRRA